MRLRASVAPVDEVEHSERALGPIESLEPLEPVEVGADPDADTAEEQPSPPRWTRRILMVVCWTALGFAAILVVSVTLPNLFGMRDLTVLSGSMEPTIHTGDVVVEREISALDAELGDVISFKDPENPSVLITHRIQDMQVHKGVVEFVTKGDANTGVERWKISGEGTIGRVEYHVWRLGYLLFWIRGQMGRLLLVVLPAMLLGAYELVRIWRPKRGEAPDEPTA